MTPPPIKQPRRERTRAALLAAAGRTFAARGYHGASLDEIAAAAGVSKGALYYSFASKEALFVALLRQLLEERLAETRDGGDGVGAAARRFEAQIARDPRWLPLLLEFLAVGVREKSVGDALARDFFGVARRDLARTIEAAGIPTGRFSAEALATGVAALANGLAIERLFVAQAVPDGLLGALLETLARGLGHTHNQQREDGMSDAERFVERFTDVWRAPEPAQFADLWTEDGRLRHPGMEEPIGRDAIPAYVERIKSVAPDIHLTPTRWAAAGDDVLIEWTIEASVGDEPVSWSGVDRFTLRGDRAVEGIAYFDTAPLWARLNPDMPQGSALEEAAARLADG